MDKDVLSDLSLKHGLKSFSKELHENGIEHFVFFGTLLGICREGEPISGDDDVDFYVNKRHYTNVKAIIDSLEISVDYSRFPNDSDCFIQVNGELLGRQVTVDFYFYDSDADQDYILENWNFTAQPNNQEKILKVPKPLIFPIKFISYDSCKIAIPNHAEIICEFLYGANWKTKQKKGLDYQVTMLGGRPLRLSVHNGVANLIP